MLQNNRIMIPPTSLTFHELPLSLIMWDDISYDLRCFLWQNLAKHSAIAALLPISKQIYQTRQTIWSHFLNANKRDITNRNAETPHNFNSRQQQRNKDSLEEILFPRPPETRSLILQITNIYADPKRNWFCVTIGT